MMSDIETKLVNEAIDKIKELLNEKYHLREVIRAMADADRDSDTCAVQAMAKETLKRS